MFRARNEITFVFCFSKEAGCSGGYLTALSTLTSIVLSRLSSVLSQAELNAPLALQKAASSSLWRQSGGQLCLSLRHPALCQRLPELLSASLPGFAQQSSQSTATIITAHVLLLGEPQSSSQRNRAPALKGLHFDRQRKRGKLRGGRWEEDCCMHSI